MQSALLAVLLAFTLMLAGLPLVATIEAGNQQAVLSMDICHPGQALSTVSTQCSLPLKSTPQLISVVVPAARWREATIPIRSIDPTPPLPPPPECSLI